MRIQVRRIRLTALFLALLTSALQGQEADVAPDPIRVDVNLLTLRFVVRDASGAFVNSLSQDDFRVLENGADKDIVFFTPPRNQDARVRRLWLGFLLDVSGSTFATRAEEIMAAQTFLDNITDATQTGVFGFTDVLIPFQKFTSNRGLALKAFREAHSHLGRTALYDSLTQLMSQMNSSAQEGDDKAIIIVSDGMDDAYKKTSETSTIARQDGIRLYTILVPSAAQIYMKSSPAETQKASSEEDAEQQRKEDAFADLSRRTGGKNFSGFETILNFDDTLAQINDDLFGNLYSIGYYAETLDSPVRNRRINVQTRNVSLEASIPFRKLPRQMEAKKNLIAALFDNSPIEEVPMDSRFREIGAELDLLSQQRDGGLIGLPFRIKISPFSFVGSNRQGVHTQLGVVGLLINQSGEEIVRLREVFRVSLDARKIRDGQGIVYTNKLMAPPGRYQLKIALLELATWRLTSFHAYVRIREP
jgi:VWFA-related protein